MMICETTLGNVKVKVCKLVFVVEWAYTWKLHHLHLMESLFGRSVQVLEASREIVGQHGGIHGRRGGGAGRLVCEEYSCCGHNPDTRR